MTFDQINLLKDTYLTESTKPNGNKSTVGEAMVFHFTNGMQFTTSRDFVIFDEENKLIHCVCANEDPIGQADFPIKVFSGNADVVDLVEAVLSKENFEKTMEDGFLSTISEEKKEFLKKFASYLRNQAIRPMEAEPYYDTTPEIVPGGTFVIRREDGITNPQPPKPDIIDTSAGNYASNPLTSVEEYLEAADKFAGRDVYVTLNGQTITSALGLPDTSDVANPPKMHLSITNCTFDGVDAKIDIANAQELEVDGCTFINGDGNGSYINAKITSIEDAEIAIKNSSFSYAGDTDSAIKIAAVNPAAANAGISTLAESEEAAPTAGTISALNIDNCKFEGGVSDIVLGIASDGSVDNSASGEFEVRIQNCADYVLLDEQYLVDTSEGDTNALTQITPNKFVSKKPDTQIYPVAGHLGTRTNPYISVKEYNDAYGSGLLNDQDVYLTIHGAKFTNASLGLVNTQNVENPPRLYLTLDSCSFDGATAGGKQIYAPNVQSLSVTNCEFKNNSVSDYGIDVNLCSIEDANIRIENSVFDSTGTKSAIKVSARKGATDHPDDISVTKPATVDWLTVTGCSFSNNVCDVTIGTTPKGEDTEPNSSTGAYAVTISNCLTNVLVKEPYIVGKDAEVPFYVVEAGASAWKNNQSSFYNKYVLGPALVETDFTAVDVIANTEEGLTAAITNAEENAVIFVDPIVAVAAAMTIDKSINLVSNGATINKPVTVTGENVSISGFTLDTTEEDAGDGKGKYVIDVMSTGSFSLKNSSLNTNSKAYNILRIACPSTVIEGNYFNAATDGTSYNCIEYSQNATYAITDAVIKDNHFYKNAASNNNISMFQFAEGAVVNVEGNYFERAANGLRLSNYSSSKNVKVNITNNQYDDAGTTEAYVGFLLCQAVSSYNDDFTGITVTFKNLIMPNGEVATENGTGFDRVWYTWEATTEPVVIFAK